MNSYSCRRCRAAFKIGCRYEVHDYETATVTDQASCQAFAAQQAARLAADHGLTVTVHEALFCANPPAAPITLEECEAVPEPPLPVIPITNFRFAGESFDNTANFDDWICNVVPAPSTTTMTNLGNGCYEEQTVGATQPMMEWTGPMNSLELEYGRIGQIAEPVILTFASITFGRYTWANNATPMNPGEFRDSDIHPGDGSQLRFTYLSGPTGTDAPRMLESVFAFRHRISIHGGGADSNTPPIRVRITRIA